ncbi:MAG TPA: ROK family protein, partial [Candidatus Saccharimonadales bacterium]|nr:ROK family protein [Candidatus Saccharimonadales bacterium]
KTDDDFEVGYKNIFNAIREVSEDQPMEAIEISHVGAVSEDKTLMLSSANLPSYVKKPLVEKLKEEFQTKVALENDSICAGLSEFAYGEYKGTDKMAYMTISTGMGAVIIKQVGDSYQVLMADVGHITVIGDGRFCTCGKTDCIEAYASGKSLGTRFGGDAAKIDDLLIWEKAVEYLAISSANLITMFHPNVLIFGGGIIENNEYVRQKIQDEIKSQMRVATMPPIAISTFGDKVGVYGALALLKLNPSV